MGMNSSISVVAAVMGTEHCAWGGNEDDFLSPCSSLMSTCGKSSRKFDKLIVHSVINCGQISGKEMREKSAKTDPILPLAFVFPL